MSRKLSVIVTAILLAISSLTSVPSQAQAAPIGPGWYFVSICGLYGEAAAQYCWFGQAAYIGAYTSEASCVEHLTLMVNYGNLLVIWPYAPSGCFYVN